MDYLVVGVLGLTSGALLDRYVFSTGEHTSSVKWHTVILQKLLLSLIAAALYLTVLNRYDMSMGFAYGTLLVLFLLSACFFDIKTGDIPWELFLLILLLAVSRILLKPGTEMDSLAGFTGTAFILLLLKVLTKGGVGMKDIILASCCGALLGLMGIMSLLIISTTLCGITGIFLIAAGASKLRNAMPFPPFILGGYLISVIFKLF
jgi:leader peptidase (prepilin peptidase)/N-methyltransferase